MGSSACRGIRSPSLFLEAICERYVADGIKVRDDVACGVTKSASSYSCQGRVRDLDLARVFPRNEIEAQDGRWRAPEEATGTGLGLGSGICERR